MKLSVLLLMIFVVACGAADHAQLTRVQHAHQREVDACEQQHDGVACLTIGTAIVESRWWRHIDWRTDEQSALALHYLSLACDAKLADGCDKAGFQSFHTPGDTLLQTISLYDRGCSLGDLCACGLALLLAQQYYEPHPTQLADFERLATSVCDRQPSECIDAAGRFPSLKTADPRVDELRRALIRRGCEQAPDSCAYTMAGEPRVGLFLLDEAKAIAERADARQLELCEQGNWNWCERMQSALEKMLSDVAQHDRAIEIAARNCRAGSSKACQILGKHIVDSEIPPKPAPPRDPNERESPVYPD